MSDLEDLEYEIEELKEANKGLGKENEDLKDEIKDLNRRIEKMSDAAYEMYQM